MATQPLLRVFSNAVETELAWAPRAAWLPMFALWAGLSSCGSDAGTTAPPPPPPSPPTVASVAITPDTATLDAIGATVQLTATAYEADGTPISGKTFTWACADEAIASVSASGQVAAKLHGTATISATTDGVAGTTTVQVQLMSTTVDVGPSGGLVELEGFALTVPAGAFDAAYTVSIDTTSDGDDLGGTSVSTTFRLSGLPETFDAPLTVRLAYEDSLTDDSYIVLEQWAVDHLLRDTSLVPRLLPAADSSGFLVGELPARTVNQSSKARPAPPVNQPSAGNFDVFDDLIFGGVTGMTSLTSTHFTLRSGAGPLDLNTKQTLLETLESTLTIGGSLGLPFDAETWDWPVDVRIRSRQKATKLWGPEFGRELPTFQLKRLQAALVHIPQQLVDAELFQTVKEKLGPQLVYKELLFAYLRANNWWPQAPSHSCLAFAIASWSEERFVDPGRFLFPQHFLANALEPFAGLRAIDAYDWIQREETWCSGLSPVIKHLVDEEELRTPDIANIFKKLRPTGDNTVDALLESVSTLPADWWPDFFEKYVDGEVYDVPSGTFTAHVSGTWDVTNGQEEKVFELEYADLSAKLFLIKLNEDALAPSMNMVLSTTGDVFNDELATIVYGLQDDDSRTHLATRKVGGDLEIPDLKDHYENGQKRFLVVVVNSHPPDLAGDKAVELRARLETPLPFTSASVSVIVNTEFEIQTETSTFSMWAVQSYGSPHATGGFVGNTFSGTYDESGFQGTVTATLNSTRDTVTSLTWTEQGADASGYVRTTEFGGKDIPVVEIFLGWFELEGTDVCDGSHIEKLTYNSVRSSPLHRNTLIGYNCEETNAKITVRFGYQ